LHHRERASCNKRRGPKGYVASRRNPEGHRVPDRRRRVGRLENLTCCCSLAPTAVVGAVAPKGHLMPSQARSVR
jgi:hypothetical protein